MSVQISQLGSLSESTGNVDLDKAIQIAGYSYDADQDIFFSTADSWQRHVGYCQFYDEAAALLGMIIDSEPVFFEYENKKWMIGFWKGQYDMVTGGEIGVYTGVLDLNLPGFFNSTFYNSVSDNEQLQMKFALKKNGKTLFVREGRHWWLTGFKLGEFSEPSELTMEITITFEDPIMLEAFATGLKEAGYSSEEISITGRVISFTFGTPHRKQPLTRTKDTDWIVQRKNELLCKEYQEITGPYNNVRDKVRAIETQAPELYKQILKLGKNKQAFAILSITIMFGTLLLSSFANRTK